MTLAAKHKQKGISAVLWSILYLSQVTSTLQHSTHFSLIASFPNIMAHSVSVYSKLTRNFAKHGLYVMPIFLFYLFIFFCANLGLYFCQTASSPKGRLSLISLTITIFLVSTNVLVWQNYRKLWAVAMFSEWPLLNGFLSDLFSDLNSIVKYDHTPSWSNAVFHPVVSLSGSLRQLKLTARKIVSSPHTITSASLPSPSLQAPHSRVFISPVLPLPLCSTTLISSHETSMWNVVRWLSLTQCHSIPSFLCLLF